MRRLMLKASCRLLLGLLFSGIVSTGSAQSKRAASAEAAPRYFQITLDLNFGPVPDQQPTTQTISTEVAVRDGRPGHCKARMISQVPIGKGMQTKYIDVGTKLDCDDVHTEGDGIALQFTLETSRIARMIKTKTGDGSETEEPIITERTVQLTVKLPLDQKKVVFDSSTHSMQQPRKPLTENARTKDANLPPPAQDAPMLIEMTASELK